MNRFQLFQLLQNGENSGLEFKRDDIHPQKLAGEIVALLNLEGGHILLGIEDDTTVSGLTRDPKEAEEWVMQIAREHIQPAVIPYWETLDWGNGKVVGVVTLSADAPDKPYKVKSGSSWVTRIRVGTTTRDATSPDRSRVLAAWGCASAEKPLRCGMMRVSRHVSDPLEGASPRWTVAALVM